MSGACPDQDNCRLHLATPRPGSINAMILISSIHQIPVALPSKPAAFLVRLVNVDAVDR